MWYSKFLNGIKLKQWTHITIPIKWKYNIEKGKIILLAKHWWINCVWKGYQFFLIFCYIQFSVISLKNSAHPLRCRNVFPTGSHLSFLWTRKNFACSLFLVIIMFYHILITLTKILSTISRTIHNWSLLPLQNTFLYMVPSLIFPPTKGSILSLLLAPFQLLKF